MKKASFRRGSAAKHLLLTLLICLTSTLLFAGVPQDYSENIQVNYQLTDVKVKDSAGKHITGLTKDDFILTVDGKPFDLKSLEEVLSESGRSEKIRHYMSELKNTPKGVTPPKPPIPPRFIVIIFDRGNMGDRAFIHSKHVAKRLVKETLLPFDRVAVFMINGTVKTLTGPTTDRNRILNAIDRAQGMRANDLYNLHQFEINPLIEIAPPANLEDPRPAKPGNINKPTMDSRKAEAELLTRNYFDIFRTMSKIFQRMPEKKSVLFFSEGFARSSTFLKLHQDYISSLNFFNSGNTTFFPIKRGPRIPQWAASTSIEQSRFEGVPNMPDYARKISLERDDMLHEVADNTNGEFFDQVVKDDDLLASLENEIGNYYMLGFIPPATDDKTHKINVSVKGHPEYQVLHRQKFITPKSFARLNDSERRIHLEEGFLTPGFHQQLDLKVFSDFYSDNGQPKVSLALSIPADKLSVKARKGYELELVVNVEDANGQIRRRVHKTFSADEVTGKMLQCVEELSVLREPYAIYLALRDNSSGNRSTWYKTIYPKAHHMKKERAVSPFDANYVDVSKWKSREIDDGVKVTR
jgi:VWFA-related protein